MEPTESSLNETSGLKPGCFYWVQPVLDPDAKEEWEQKDQPARFCGLNDRGDALWNCLGLEGESEWPMRWIGPEITR